MIINIKSSNAHLLDVLYKNPDTDFGLYLKPLRNGVMVGNCVSAHEYEVVFQDTKHSFVQDDTQLDFQSYCNPNVALNIVSDLFSHLLIDKNMYWSKSISWLEKTYQDIDNEPVTIVLPNIYMDSRWFKDGVFVLSKYLPQVTLTQLKTFHFELKITAESVFEGINLLAIVACFIDMTNSFRTPFLTEDWYVKYVRIMTNVPNVPYFVFYLFITRCIRSVQVFESIKPTMEAYFDNKTQFVFTDTHQTRKVEVFKALGVDLPILDIGCGEMQYYKMFRGKGFKHQYFAVDREDDVANLVAKLQAADEKIEFYQDLDAYQHSEKVNIIISEVIEHNTIDETYAFLAKVKTLNYESIAITTPNRSFNIHYAMNAEFRREDHIYEMDSTEFQTLIHHVFGQHKVEIFGIGDCVNGDYPTQMAIVRD